MVYFILEEVRINKSFFYNFLFIQEPDDEIIKSGVNPDNIR